VFAAFVAWIVHGARWVRERPLPGLVALGTLVVLGIGAAEGIKTWRPPVDERYYTVYPGERKEFPARVEDKAERLTDIGLLPDFAQLNRFGTFLSLRKISEIWPDLGAPKVEAERRAWGWFPSETPAPGPPVIIELDLRRPLYGRTDFITLLHDDREPDIDLVAMPEMARLQDITVEWDGKPIMLYTTRSNDVSLLQLFFVDPNELEFKRDFADKDYVEQCKLFSLLAGMDGEGQCGCREDEGLDCRELVPIELPIEPSRVLRIRMPAGGLSVATTVNRSAQKVLLWKAVVTPESLEVQEAIEPWHN